MKAHTPIRVFCLPLLLAALSVAACTSVTAEPAESAWRHVENGQTYEVADHFGPEKLDYKVHWDSFILDETDGAAGSVISGTSYLRTCDCAPTQRPVVFLFNGGPGASSSPLHFALGPHARERGAAAFPDNSNTILRAADLVFIDPVETGFSRAAAPDGSSRFLGVNGDVEAVSAFIHNWMTAHEREGAPVFIVGQSYGGFRLANLLPSVDDVNVQGLVMVSPMLNASASASDLGNVFALPTMAATAWRFGKSSIEASSEAEAWETARRFSETELLVALEQGDLLDPSEKQRLAAQIAAMTGLPVDMVLEANLRVDIQAFLETLLADDQLLVSRLNTAKTEALKPAPANPDRPAAANDPSLGLGRSNKILASDIAAYLTDTTGLDQGKDYWSLNLDANFAWDWSGANRELFFTDATPLVANFMSANADARLLVFGGYRDLAVPLLATRYALTHAGLPQARVELAMVPSGHSPFDEDALKAPFAERIYALIQTHTANLAAKGE
jgi:carboxypeptidase C (cathepsin A)